MPGKEIKGTSKIANYRHGCRAGFKEAGSVKGGAISRLTGDTGGVKEVFPGMGITGGASGKSLSSRVLKHNVKKVQKMPDKTFKYNNPGTRTYKSDRTGKEVTVSKKELVKGSIGKKKYIQDMKRHHHQTEAKGKK